MRFYSLKTKEEKMLETAIFVLAGIIALIFGVVFFILATKSNIVSPKKYTYNCSSFEEQIKNTNKYSLDYYNKSISSEYDSILISPLCIQSSVYEYYDTCGEQRPQVFSLFNNGFKTWDESRRLFGFDCFMTFVPDTIDSNEDLIGRTASATEGYLNSLGVDIEYNANTLYSVFHVPLSIKKGKYCTEDDLVYYDGELGYKKTSDYEAIKLPMSSKDYELYLIDGDLTTFDFTGFTEREGLVTIDSYTWQSYGTVNGIATKLGYTQSDLVMLAQFGFSSDNNEVVNEINSITENKFYYVSEFSFILTDKETGLILAIGKHK